MKVKKLYFFLKNLIMNFKKSNNIFNCVSSLSYPTTRIMTGLKLSFEAASSDILWSVTIL